MARPESFDERSTEQWSLWVISNGLPALPGEVTKGESVPVARWVDDAVAGVLHVQWMWADDGEDDYVASEVELFREK